jgi:5-formyltetrahydrofolate cyclo-ligase
MKAQTRQTILARRDAMSAIARAAASAEIAQRTAALLSLHRVATVALYAPKGSEVDTAALDAAIRTAGGSVVYPRVDHAHAARELAFHVVVPADLVPARFGLREPAPDARTQVALAGIDAFIVPGLAFDREGGRIGWGRGHYDATLSAVPSALRIGLGFECQLVATVPHEPHDVRLHFVVTELDTYRTPD